MSEFVGESPRVLLVEDDENNLCVTAVLLVPENRVLTARGGAEALAILERESPDVVVSDLRMPGLDGLAVLARVRELRPEAGRMIVTGYSEIPDILDAVNRGLVDRWMMKPFHPEELRIVVRQLAADSRARRERRELAANLAARNAELERTVERALTAERMAMVGRFAAESAHELGNLAQIVMATAEGLALRGRKGDGRAAAAGAERIVRSSGRCATWPAGYSSAGGFRRTSRRWCGTAMARSRRRERRPS